MSVRAASARGRAALALFTCAVLLAACAAPEPPRGGGGVVEIAAEGSLLPNENLVLQGVPPIPMSLVRQVERYTDFRGHGFADWHPVREEMLVAHRKAGASTEQLFRLSGPLASPEQLTAFTDPVREASYEPRAGRYAVFARASGGNEADLLYRLDLDTLATTALTGADERHRIVAWLRGRSDLIYSAVPLDRTAEGGTRTEPGTTLWIVDPLRPESRRKLAELPGSAWFQGTVSHDDRRLALTRYRSAGESQVWEIDLADGRASQRLPAPGETLAATHFPVAYRPGSSDLFVLSDRAGEFRELMLHVEGSGSLQRVTAGIPWDVASADLSDDGRLLAVRVSVDGRSELRLFDAINLQERAAPALPGGSIDAARFHRSGQWLAFTVDGASGPSRVHALDLASGRTTPWTVPHAPAAVDTARFTEQRIVRWNSFDGLPLSAIYTPAAPRFAGKRPVMVLVHGGPEAQATLGFMGRWNYLGQELGIAILQPNVRGSAGYGKTFLTLDNGMKREDAVKDLGTLLDWVATQPELDAARVVVSGGSYGGYMSLAASVHHGERLAGAIDIVGISHFVSFLENTESYRRDLRRAEYGDEREPEMRAFLESISPLNHAERITKPLFVVQGRNDPRVPWTEAEQIVERVRRSGTEVWYLRADNEGHGFARKENADFQFYATVRFLQKTLLQ